MTFTEYDFSEMSFEQIQQIQVMAQYAMETKIRMEAEAKAEAERKAERKAKEEELAQTLEKARRLKQELAQAHSGTVSSSASSGSFGSSPSPFDFGLLWKMGDSANPMQAEIPAGAVYVRDVEESGEESGEEPGEGEWYDDDDTSDPTTLSEGWGIYCQFAREVPVIPPFPVEMAVNAADMVPDWKTWNEEQKCAYLFDLYETTLSAPEPRKMESDFDENIYGLAPEQQRYYEYPCEADGCNEVVFWDHLKAIEQYGPSADAPRFCCKACKEEAWKIKKQAREEARMGPCQFEHHGVLCCDKMTSHKFCRDHSNLVLSRCEIKQAARAAEEKTERVISTRRRPPPESFKTGGLFRHLADVGI